MNIIICIIIIYVIKKTLQLDFSVFIYLCYHFKLIYHAPFMNSLSVRDGIKKLKMTTLLLKQLQFIQLFSGSPRLHAHCVLRITSLITARGRNQLS
jgi:hypothetical protein